MGSMMMDRVGLVRGRLMMPLVMMPLVAVMVAIATAKQAIAHGVKLDYRSTQALEVQAAYDSGEPMANAQVSVYSPENPSDPWLTGTTDEQGRFTFTPDLAIAGNWDVQVRQAGHGDIISIPMQGKGASGTLLSSASNSTAPSTLQKAVMAGSVIWGMVGTALFFSSRRSKKHAHS